MRRFQVLLLASVPLVASAARAPGAQYVTDLPAFNILPPCVASAISYNVNYQTYSASCGIAQDELQSCICSSSALREVVTSAISRDIATDCGGPPASDEQASASSLFEQYCSPDATLKFSTPTTNIVNAYITDLSQMAWLAPCASDGLSYGVMKEAQSRCPEEPSLFAPCVCSKESVAKDVSSTVSSMVRSSCGGDEDVTSAYDFYHEYCRMNEGTTSFAKPKGPPGDMTYHITDLPEFKSLRTCAQSAVESAIQGQTYSYCGSGPQALASCACIKSGMLRKVSSTLTSNVRYYCDVTATADVSSALDVLDYYCSAAEGDVVAKVSVSRSSSASGAATPSETGSGASKGDSDTQDDGDSSSGGGGGENQTAIIAASVLGGVIAIALVVGVAIFIRRKKKKAAAREVHPDSPTHLFHPELEDNGSRTDVAKSGMTESHELGDRGIVEMPNQARLNELQNQTGADRYVTSDNAQELPSATSGSGQWPLQSPQQSQTAASTSPMTPAQQGLGWQSGPVEAYEMDASQKRG